MEITIINVRKLFRHPDSLVLRHLTYMLEFAIGISINVLHESSARWRTWPINMAEYGKGRTKKSSTRWRSFSYLILRWYSCTKNYLWGLQFICPCMAAASTTWAIWRGYSWSPCLLCAQIALPQSPSLFWALFWVIQGHIHCTPHW